MKIKKIDFKKINIKKGLIVLLFVGLASYVFYDVSLKLRSNFRLQGYSVAVAELVEQAKNEECYPFNIFFGEEEINLINVDCLQQQDTGMEGMMLDEEIEVE
jgi:hypothetical protein